MQRPKQVTAAWLALLWMVNVGLFLVLQYASVRTISGQMLDTVALDGNSLGRRTVDGPLDVALNAVSVVSLVLVLVVIGAVAAVRRRYSLAIMSATVVVGSSLTTYVLKSQLITRPEFGVDPARSGAGNSFPSGHTTAAAAFAIGLTLVLPPAARGIASVIGATYAAVVGIATLSSGWHRPSDVVAAYLIAGGWAAYAGLLLVLVQRSSAVVTSADRAGWSLAAALAAGAVLTMAGLAVLVFVFERMSAPVDAMASGLLRLGYLGSALTIAGAAYLMMAVVLVSVHRVVPHRPAVRSDETTPAVASSEMSA
jgi:membrane-associated phospholipid phosphatase